MNMTIQIIPAPLSLNREELEMKLLRMRGLASLVQIDVADGIFAHNRTWPLTDARGFSKIVSQEEGMPFWEDFDFEFDLMVANPAIEVPRCISAGASRVVVHLGALKNRSDSKELVEQWREQVEVVAGIGVEDFVAEIEHVFGGVDGIQCMGIARIGFQREPFDERCLAQIKEAKKRYPHLPIAVDGAVNDETAPLLVKAGATRLSVGSFLFSSGEEKERFDLIQEIAQAAANEG